jgi:UDP-GlcNAc3NAcA epimerase
MIKILTIVGARPQFIKAAAVSRVIRSEFSRKISEVLVHTGQHYDENMSKVFFDELDIPNPKYNLEVAGGAHGAMTGRMLEAVEQVLLSEKPNWLLIYGDTNSTLAGALAAAKLHIPIAHVEAGLRSFNMRMPEEINRILADRVSTLLFCPTYAAVSNLRAEGLGNGVHNVGDVMFDVALHYREKALRHSTAMARLGLIAGDFVLATCHRAENTDDPDRLGNIAAALGEISKSLPVLLPLHPRTRKQLAEYKLDGLLGKTMVIDPLPFLDMVALEQAAKLIMTDSGGVQKEAFFFGVPCITMRNETEWVETVETGWNQLSGTSIDTIVRAYSMAKRPPRSLESYPYGDGNAAHGILEILINMQN